MCLSVCSMQLVDNMLVSYKSFDMMFVNSIQGGGVCKIAHPYGFLHLQSGKINIFARKFLTFSFYLFNTFLEDFISLPPQLRKLRVVI